SARPLVGASDGVFAGGERRELKGLEQAHFTFALESAGYRDDDVYDAQVHATVLGGGMSSRLFQEVREKRGLCYSIFAQPWAFADTGMLTLYAGTSGEQVGALAELTVDELRRSASDLSEVEIDRAKAQMKAGLLMGLESASSRCERLARMLAIWDRVPTLEETVAKIDAVNRQSVTDYAARLCARGSTAMAIYGPVEGTPELPALTERLAA
ncbi:MAG: insulinase family protein, partial [Pseudomonadota bacterium]